MDTKEFITMLSHTTGISGHEAEIGQKIADVFLNYTDEVTNDPLGNVIALKKGEGEKRPRIMLAAHMDEIGLMVIKIEKNGFIRFAPVGGVDQRTLLAQEVIVHGKRPVPGVIGAKPPHLQGPDDRKHAVKREEMFIDVGMAEDEVKAVISVGDLITVRRQVVSMQNNFIAGKSLDDRAGVGVVLETLKELQNLRHKADVYAVATVMEEVALGGAFTSAFGINPDLAVAIDVCHGDMPGVSEQLTAEMDKGPSLALGPNIHPKIYERLTEIAKERGIPYQVDPAPGATGTDAWAIQVTRSGIPCGLVSIPLRYMHTSVETLALNDVKLSGRLLAYFIASLDSDFVEGLSCF